LHWERSGRRNREGRGSEAAKEKEKWGGGGDEDAESRIMCILWPHEQFAKILERKRKGDRRQRSRH